MADKLLNRFGQTHPRKLLRETTLTGWRFEIWKQGLRELPRLCIKTQGLLNGDALATDEASVWKRVLSYRIAKALQPKTILETHPGAGITSQLFQIAAPRSKLLDYNHGHVPGGVDLIDVDPFGQPWPFLRGVISRLAGSGVVMVSSGEVQAVVRRLRKAQTFKTNYYGRETPTWIVKEHIPRLEDLCQARAAFFYAFPTSVRVILARTELPTSLWDGCPRWMWWFSKYGATR